MTKKKQPTSIDMRQMYDEWQMMFERDGLGLAKSLLIAVQSNPTATIKDLSPHYTNEAFKSPQTVYLAKGYKLDPEYVRGAHYIFSDRLWQQKNDEMRTACAVAKEQKFNLDCAATIEMMLRMVMVKPNLKLVHIMSAFVNSTGFPYQVYGVFEEGDNDSL